MNRCPTFRPALVTPSDRHQFPEQEKTCAASRAAAPVSRTKAAFSRRRCGIRTWRVVRRGHKRLLDAAEAAHRNIGGRGFNRAMLTISGHGFQRKPGHEWKTKTPKRIDMFGKHHQKDLGSKMRQNSLMTSPLKNTERL